MDINIGRNIHEKSRGEERRRRGEEEEEEEAANRVIRGEESCF